MRGDILWEMISRALGFHMMKMSFNLEERPPDGLFSSLNFTNNVRESINRNARRFASFVGCGLEATTAFVSF